MSHNPKSIIATSVADTLVNSDNSLSASKDCSQSDAYSETYFEVLYTDNSDPWQYQTRWYEKRKRDMCLAVLPQAKYTNAIELGCGNGVFSELLARRCQSLLSLDGNAKAVQLARQRLRDLSGVKVVQGIIPGALFTLENDALSDNAPTYHPPFDAIIISEILYYLSPADIDSVIKWIKQNLATGGTLLCCHWRYVIEGFTMTGETVHQRLQQAFDASTHQAEHLAFEHQSQIIDRDFLLDVWQYSDQSVAMQENLI